MKAVFDPNVIISATLTPDGSPGRLFRHWLEGAFDIVVSPMLLDELDRSLRYPKLRERVPAQEASRLIELLAHEGIAAEDAPQPPHVSSRDPDDDYLIALADAARSALVTGDGDLLDLAGRIPVYSPAAFLAMVQAAL